MDHTLPKVDLVVVEVVAVVVAVVGVEVGLSTRKLRHKRDWYGVTRYIQVRHRSKLRDRHMTLSITAETPSTQIP
jgi:hypothetical protein